jgi:hypothetical protein
LFAAEQAGPQPRWVPERSPAASVLLVCRKAHYVHVGGVCLQCSFALTLQSMQVHMSLDVQPLLIAGTTVCCTFFSRASVFEPACAATADDYLLCTGSTVLPSTRCAMVSLRWSRSFLGMLRQPLLVAGQYILQYCLPRCPALHRQAINAVVSDWLAGALLVACSSCMPTPGDVQCAGTVVSDHTVFPHAAAEVGEGSSPMSACHGACDGHSSCVLQPLGGGLQSSMGPQCPMVVHARCGSVWPTDSLF